MTERHTQPKDRQPDDFDRDLHPNANAGINDSRLGANPEADAPSAYDLTDLHRLLPNLNDDELRRVTVLRPGDMLEQGATYLDLRHMDRGEFTAQKPEQVGPATMNLIIPKQGTDYLVWNKLRGVTEPERLDQADES